MCTKFSARTFSRERPCCFNSQGSVVHKKKKVNVNPGINNKLALSFPGLKRPDSE